MAVPLITVKCASCGHEQCEPSGSISTACVKCQAYIAVDPLNEIKVPETAKRTRVVVCPHCERTQKVYPQALTIVCVECGTHVNIANHTVSGKVSHSLATFGEVTFTRGCQYTGVEVCAQTIQVSGQLQTRLKAYRDLIFSDRSVVTGPSTAEKIIILASAKVQAKRMSANEFEVMGYVNAESVVATRKLVVKAGGYLSAKTIRAGEIEVEEGGGMEGEFGSIPHAT